ncbi:MAG TPA: hypothetical protein VK559_07085 [Ferruginibacter sp.]|nr:hypothetical protein [Ferruginibacter sp.]
MKSFLKRLLVFAIILGTVSVAFADKGVKRKARTRTKINITAPVSLKNLMTLNLNLKSGLIYKGSLLSSTDVVGPVYVNTSILTYQKGNTTYIIPYKHKMALPDVQQGYTGLKFIIRSKK